MNRDMLALAVVRAVRAGAPIGAKAVGERDSASITSGSLPNLRAVLMLNDGGEVCTEPYSSSH